MRNLTAGLLGGLLAGAGVAAVIVVERRSATPAGPEPKADPKPQATHRPETLQSVPAPGDDGPDAEAMLHEQAGQLAATAGFGATYLFLRHRFGRLPPLGLGAIYGAGVYAARLTRKTPQTGTLVRPVTTATLAWNLALGAGTAIAFAWLSNSGQDVPGS